MPAARVTATGTNRADRRGRRGPAPAGFAVGDPGHASASRPTQLASVRRVQGRTPSRHLAAGQLGRVRSDSKPRSSQCPWRRSRSVCQHRWAGRGSCAATSAPKPLSTNVWRVSAQRPGPATHACFAAHEGLLVPGPRARMGTQLTRHSGRDLEASAARACVAACAGCAGRRCGGGRGLFPAHAAFRKARVGAPEHRRKGAGALGLRPVDAVRGVPVVHEWRRAGAAAR